MRGTGAAWQAGGHGQQCAPWASCHRQCSQRQSSPNRPTWGEDQLALVQPVLCQEAGDEVALRDVHLRGTAQRAQQGAAGRQVDSGQAWLMRAAQSRLPPTHPPTNQPPPAAHLFGERVARQLDHLQAVEQRRRDVAAAVGGRHKEGRGEVKGEGEVGIHKGAILLRVQHLVKARRVVWETDGEGE